MTIKTATDARGLSKRQRDFVDFFLIRPNSPEWCAIQAGYRKGSQAGYKLLYQKRVLNAIHEAQTARAQRVHLTADRVVNELASVALANMTDYIEITKKGDIRIKSDIAPEKMAAVKQIRTYKDGTMVVSLHDKMKALTELAAHMGVTNFERRPTDMDHEEAKVIKIIDRRTKVLSAVDTPKTLDAAAAVGVLDVVDAAYEKVEADAR